MPFGSRKAQFYTRTDQFFWSEAGLKVGSENETMETLQMEMEAESRMEKHLMVSIVI